MRLAGCPEGRCSEVFVYDAVEKDLQCVSCVTSGVGNATSTLGVPSNRTISNRMSRRVLDDGRVFFTSAERLVAGDVNGKDDVYGWDDGELSLISTGRDPNASYLAEVSPDGRDVFFFTNEQLVAQDVDNQTDVYDARVGGGIASQNMDPVAPECRDDDCQSPPSGRPGRSVPGSGGGGSGDVSPAPRAVFSLSKVSKAQRTRLSNGKAATLRVRVNRAGRVRVVARAKIGKRTRTVATASKQARKAGTVDGVVAAVEDGACSG